MILTKEDKLKAIKTARRNEFAEYANQLVSVVHKNKKNYTRNIKHKTFN